MEQSKNKTSTDISENIPYKRFASLDFLRGLAIFMMLCLHMIGDYLDVNRLIGDIGINNLPLINVVALITLPFLGGLAGFFLITSAISNMVSIQNNLMRGRNVGSIIIKQIVGGFILLIFAMITEGLTGYHAAFGDFILNLNNPEAMVDANTVLSHFGDIAFTQWANFEAIHTIAWCVIINGAIQGLISLKGMWKKPKLQMLIYLILTVIVLVSTKFIWDGIYNNVIGANGIGFPWGLNSDGSRMVWPDLRTAGFGAVLVGIFINPLAAPMEPIFPYLAVSFLGSIIGIGISQPKKALFKGFTKTVLLVGLTMFLIGAAGTVMEVASVFSNVSFDEAIIFYRNISFHRHWYTDLPTILYEGQEFQQVFFYPEYITPFAWLWQVLITNGFSIMLCMIVIFLVEFRGRGNYFAQKTGYIRRYGIIAFSNYNNQWLYWLPILIFGKIGVGHMTWGETFLAMLISFGFFTIVLYLWGLVNYRFSFEWFMKSIGYVLLPIRRVGDLKEKKWWQKGDINVKALFSKEGWTNIVEENEVYHENKTDSRISMLLSIFSLAIPIFSGFTVITLPMTIKAIKREGYNNKNKTALVLSIIGVVLTVAFLVFVCVFTPASLGFYI